MLTFYHKIFQTEMQYIARIRLFEAEWKIFEKGEVFVCFILET